MLKVCLTSNSYKLFALQSTTLVATSVHVRIDTIKAGKPERQTAQAACSVRNAQGLSVQEIRDVLVKGRSVFRSVPCHNFHTLICTAGELWLVTKHNESEALETSKTVLETNKRRRLPSLLPPRGICWPCFAQEAQQVGSQVGVQRPSECAQRDTDCHLPRYVSIGQKFQILDLGQALRTALSVK